MSAYYVSGLNVNKNSIGLKLQKEGCCFTGMPIFKNFSLFTGAFQHLSKGFILPDLTAIVKLSYENICHFRLILDIGFCIPDFLGFHCRCIPEDAISSIEIFPDIATITSITVSRLGRF
jgi:hypothetical protein